jgi:hypothetical protein
MVCRSSSNPVDCATPMYPRCHGQIPAAVASGCPVACTIPDSSPMNARSESVPLRCEAVSWPRNGGVRQRIPARAGPGARRCVEGDAAAIRAYRTSVLRPTVNAVFSTRMNWRIPLGQQVGMEFGRTVDLSGAAGGRGGEPGWIRPGNAGPRVPPPARRERHLDRQWRLDLSCRHALGRIGSRAREARHEGNAWRSRIVSRQGARRR